MSRLSSAQRKKLKAKRMIGRYKGSGNKGKIMACVNRKEKSLNCKTKK